MLPPDPLSEQNAGPCPETVARIESMLEAARQGKVLDVAACLYFADGSCVKFVAGQSAEGEQQALSLLQAKLAAGN